jgi:DtxR family Mn-dependent transcriptional regulator
MKSGIHTQSIEDYLKTIYSLQQAGPVSPGAVADRLRVAPASATGMIRRLSALKLVEHEPYQTVKLTPAGERIALEVIRHHRLVELYLVEALGVPWDRVHDEAERLEHVLSDLVEDRMAAALGDPKLDPHGDPIPDRNGIVPPSQHLPLAEMQAGQEGVVRRVSDRDPAMLRYLDQLGLVPQAHIGVTAVAPFDGPVHVRVGRFEHAVGREVARRVYVEPTKTEE